MGARSLLVADACTLRCPSAPFTLSSPNTQPHLSQSHPAFSRCFATVPGLWLSNRKATPFRWQVFTTLKSRHREYFLVSPTLSHPKSNLRNHNPLRSTQSEVRPAWCMQHPLSKLKRPLTPSTNLLPPGTARNPAIGEAKFSVQRPSLFDLARASYKLVLVGGFHCCAFNFPAFHG